MEPDLSGLAISTDQINIIIVKSRLLCLLRSPEKPNLSSQESQQGPGLKAHLTSRTLRPKSSEGQ